MEKASAPSAANARDATRKMVSTVDMTSHPQKP
jgi:hypothetical protein